MPPAASRRGHHYARIVRLTVFWERMERRFGRSYADSVARDIVIATLGGRTAREAIEAGVPPRDVWAAVCEAVEIPEAERH